MKTIFFLFYDQCIINGGFFDNFEYYCLVKNIFKECNVKYRILTDHTRDDVIKILTDKYEGISQQTYNDIEIFPYYFRKVFRDPLIVDILFCATNSAVFWFLTHKNIQAAKYLLTISDYLHIHEKQNIFYPNSLTLCDERFITYETINYEPYRKKILFDKFKKKDYKSKYDYMLNLSLVDRRYSRDFIIKLIEDLNGSCCVYTGNKNKDYYDWLEEINVKVIIPPVNDFMSLFKTFVYLPYNNGWDATPRLPAECIFYGKKVIYKDFFTTKAGGYFRKNDIENDFNGLFLKEDDKIITIVEKILKDIK